jgi:hypothetical protein
MNIQKKIKCLHCGEIITVFEGTTNHCKCEKVIIVEGHVRGVLGTDYTDVSPVLLNETTTNG